MKDTVDPLIEQIDVAPRSIVKVTGRPEVAVAITL
jgi:hypothetical protein